MKLEYGVARVEFLTVRPDVGELLAQGWPRSRIYRRFLEEGKITMRYKTFCEYVRKMFPLLEDVVSERKQPVGQREEHHRASVGEGPQIIGGTRKTFQKNIVPDEELF